MDACEFTRIDLHMHSTVSDGTDVPQELIARVKAAGIGLFALTDHDAIHGCKQVISARADTDPRFIAGVEFSCKDEGGKYHILGYGYDVSAAPINALVDTTQALRLKKVHMRLEFLTSEFGFEFPPDEIEALFANDRPGKPHIGNLMVKLGYASSKDDAIKNYIDKLRIPASHIRPEAAIEAILNSGGIPVLAHPIYGDGDDLIMGHDMEERLIRLMDLGIRGVEAYYSGFTRKMQQELLGYADRYDLLVTAGSDYHGKNKLIELGDNNLEDVAQAHPGLHRFLDEIADRIN